MRLVNVLRAAAFVLPVSPVTLAFAQATGAGAPILIPVPSPTPAPASTGPLGGGNTEYSSSVAGRRDGFDFKYGSGSQSAVRGSDNGPIFSSLYGASIPPTHTVRRGDTLAGVSDYYFRSPWHWPRLWSYNPQIQNPNWIYPGDMLRLKPGARYGTQQGAGFALTDRRRIVTAGTIFLRDNGFIEDGSDEDWGELTGSPKDKTMLTVSDEVYIRVSTDRELKLGQELAVFRPVRTVQEGRVVQIQGTIRVLSYNPKVGVAKAVIVESLDVIERGARVGQLTRKYEVVPPKRNERDFVSSVIASVYPHNFWGQNQVVFIAHNEKDGLRVGNRFFVLRRGDAWRRSLVNPNAANRITPSAERLPEIERTPGGRDENLYPDEVIAELRVVAVRKNTATCLVTHSKVEIERGDVVVARRGY